MSQLTIKNIVIKIPYNRKKLTVKLSALYAGIHRSGNDLSPHFAHLIPNEYVFV